MTNLSRLLLCQWSWLLLNVKLTIFVFFSPFWFAFYNYLILVMGFWFISVTHIFWVHSTITKIALIHSAIFSYFLCGLHHYTSMLQPMSVLKYVWVNSWVIHLRCTQNQVVCDQFHYFSFKVACLRDLLRDLSLVFKADYFYLHFVSFLASRCFK